MPRNGPLGNSRGIDPRAVFCEAESVPLLPCLLLVLLLPASTLPAQDPASAKFAVVDLTAVFESHPRTAETTAQLTAARNEARKKFRSESEALKNALQRHQELLRDGKRAEAAAELEKANALERSIAELGTTNQKNLEEQFRQAKQAIMDDIARVVREFNAEKGYAMVFDKSAASSNGLPQLIDAPGAEDITAEIIARVKQ
ncbi:MAG: OmpH family outer membrane protein [Chthoniobacterales bacterium]